MFLQPAVSPLPVRIMLPGVFCLAVGSSHSFRTETVHLLLSRPQVGGFCSCRTAEAHMLSLLFWLMVGLPQMTVYALEGDLGSEHAVGPSSKLVTE